jgi:hypothetical protein
MTRNPVGGAARHSLTAGTSSYTTRSACPRLSPPPAARTSVADTGPCSNWKIRKARSDCLRQTGGTGRCTRSARSLMGTDVGLIKINVFFPTCGGDRGDEEPIRCRSLNPCSPAQGRQKPPPCGHPAPMNVPSCRRSFPLLEARCQPIWRNCNKQVALRWKILVSVRVV